ncbi:MAG: hypothetical protein Q8755_03255, partial [Candidatus Phytoplasma australasiaticum]|nr:hypothetical protein [Candidatus Phytoplasma australasiaticum]
HRRIPSSRSTATTVARPARFDKYRRSARDDWARTIHRRYAKSSRSIVARRTHANLPRDFPNWIAIRRVGDHSSLTTTLSLAPDASITEILAKPAPSGAHSDWRRALSATGRLLTIQVRGGTPPSAFRARLGAGPGSARPR